ncbi:hypothetical protein [Streptomyces catenulae]|uniref:Integral membrane protein n=1 Tax=Streptomyces catenulae TaxID=66875 RepID=A0ABV2Z5A2_9ACTN|nr:hypothetical protein [Streptomyces catenulae]
MQYLRGFLPWLAFGFVSSVGWQWGALAGLVLAAALLLTDRTAGWALSFTLTALAQAALSFHGGHPGLSIAVQVAGFVLPARFTAAYPERARARYLRDAAPQHPVRTQGA